MKWFLVILYAVLIILNAFNAGLNWSNDRRVLAIMNIICMALWAACFVLRIIS